MDLLHWLSAIPSPWEAVAAICATLTLVVTLLDRRERHRSDRPIVSAKAQGRTRIKFSVSNEAGHDLTVEQIEALSPRGLLLTAKTKHSSGGNMVFQDAEERVAQVGTVVRRAGEAPAFAGSFRTANGDRAFFDVAMAIPEYFTGDHITVAMKIVPHNVTRKPIREKIKIAIPKKTGT